MRGRAALDRVLAWFPRHAAWVLAAVVLLTAAAVATLVDPSSGRPRLQVDPSTDRLLPDDDASRLFFEHVRDVFGGDETLLVAVAGEDVFTPDALRRVERMTERIQALDGVDRVLSITNAASVRAVEGDVQIAPFVASIPEDADALAALRAEVLADPIYGGNLVSRDGRVTALLVYFLAMSNREFLERGLDAAIARIAHEERGGSEIWITGGPHIRAETARILLGETFTLSLGILAALGVVLALSFRSARGVLLPLATIAVAVCWTLAAVVLLGHALNAVTFLVPPLLIALGLSYSVHVVSEYTESARDGDDASAPDPRAAHVARVARATQGVALPVALTGLTTAAGFASLALSPLGAVREFGWLSVIGVIAAMVASLSFTPAVLALLPPATPRAERAGSGRRGLGFERLAERAARFAVARRGPIFLAAAAVFALSLAGASQLRIGTQQISKFAADAPVRTDFEAVNRHLGGANPLYVVVESESLDAFKDPANLRVLEQLQDWLRAQPEIGATASLVDTLKLIHRGFRDGDPAAYAVPESRRLVSQLFFFGGSQELDRFVDPDYRTASLHLRARVIDSDDVAALVQRVETRLAELPASLQGRVTGTSVVLAGALDDIIRGQTLSVLAALGIIYAILAALFVSFRIGAVALIPNVLPVAAFFGALGALGIRLGPGISLVAPMVLGIAVDDTIHYFSRFIREVRRSADEERATVTTLQAVGRPVTYTSLALVAGFLVLTTSELRSQVELGAMASFALGFAWLTDFFVTPALCARLRIATLWDLLSVDLGRDPHRSISLLRGLRASEARIVALLASVVHVREGEHLFREGEPGEAVYAVLDGRLRTSTAHGTGRLELARHERGDALGEVGLLHLARSADVEALGDARLLRFTQESIDQLARRYPRIATVVYRNLSEIAADRLARATSGLRDAASGTVAHAPALPDPRRDAGRLERAGRALADAFFGDDGAADRAALAHTAAEADGGTPGSESALLLAALGLRPDVVAALTLLPLVEVAWSDGRLQPGERQAVLAVAAGRDTPAEPALLHRLGVWLDRPPTPQLRVFWRDAVAAVCAELSVESRMRLRDGVLASARGVAESAGGLLGVGSVSRREARVLVELESAFSTR